MINKIKGLWCRIVGHQNTLTIVKDYRAVGERCGRCKCKLPYGYPHQKLLKELLGSNYPEDGIHLDFDKIYGGEDKWKK